MSTDMQEITPEEAVRRALWMIKVPSMTVLLVPVLAFCRPGESELHHKHWISRDEVGTANVLRQLRWRLARMVYPGAALAPLSL